MEDDPKGTALKTGRLSRFASLARAGLGTATSFALGSASGMEQALERLGDLRGIGTKVGQMAGLVEANLPSELRAKVGPALAKLRAQAATSPYEAVEKLLVEEFGATPDVVFAAFETRPFASASLGQVHRATHHDGRALAVKVQHPGIQEAFRGDLENVTSLGTVATTFLMPEGQGKVFINGVKAGFLAELDYRHEAENLLTFAALLARDRDLETPDLAADVSTARVLSTTFLRGEPVETARGYPPELRRRQAAAVRRLVLSALMDHGLLYADAHAGNFLFRDDGTVGVLDFGSVFRFDDAPRRAFAELREAVFADDRARFTRAVADAYGLRDEAVAAALASIQWHTLGRLVRGSVIDAQHVRAIMERTRETKRKLFGARFALPPFVPFLMRTLLATNALLLALEAPESGPLEPLA